MKTVQTFGLAAVVSFGAATATNAHVTFLDPEAPQEKTILATLQVPHGCDGKPTNEVRVKLPEGFVFAKPQPKPGWELEVMKGDYQKSYDDHGTQVKSGAVEIRWKGGNLSDDFYDAFVIRGKVSGVEAGTSLAFPVKQLCGDAVEAWDQVAADGGDPHKLKSAAPVLTVVAGAEHDHDHNMAGMDMSDTAGDTVTLGDLQISGAFAKAMLPGQPVGGGFFTIRNSGKTGDRLVAVSSSNAGEVELHEMAMQDNVMKMRELKDGLAVPAGGTVTLAPGGLHLMFQKVKAPFKQGDRVPVTLTFEKAGKVDLTLKVLSAQGK